MQQLLTGKRRFPEFSEQWRQHRLGSLFAERKEVGRVELPLLSITAIRGVILREKIDRKDSSAADKSKYKRLAPSDIGYNTMRMWQGVSAQSDLEGIVSPAYTICVPGPEIDADFAAYLFKFPPIVHLFRRYSQGLVDDTLSLKYPNYAQISDRIPTIPEQKRFAEVLRTVDHEIALLNDQLDVLKLQKKGLMQRLLTGKFRVPVKGETR